jgi:transposase
MGRHQADAAEQAAWRSARHDRLVLNGIFWVRRSGAPWCGLPAHFCIAHNLIERFFSMMGQCRRVATRYDKLAASYLAFIKFASIRI